MCDYSLEAYKSRPAVEGEKLTLERFPSGSAGFTSGSSCDLAVCVPAGTHMLLEGIGDGVRQSCGLGAVEQVVMTRLETGPYKDAVRFANGTEISLQRLDRGATAVIVAFPEAPKERTESAAAPAEPELV